MELLLTVWSHPALDCSQPLYFSTYAKEKASAASTKHGRVGPESLPFYASVQFSRDSIHALNDFWQKSGTKRVNTTQYPQSGLRPRLDPWANHWRAHASQLFRKMQFKKEKEKTKPPTKKLLLYEKTYKESLYKRYQNLTK